MAAHGQKMNEVLMHFEKHTLEIEINLIRSSCKKKIVVQLSF